MLLSRNLRELHRQFSASFALNRSFVNIRNMSSGKENNRLVWVDLEMTGLDLDTCHIIEMACLITDENLTIIAEGPELVVHQPEEILSSMGEWCKKHHGESGLTAAVRSSDVSLTKAEHIMLEFVKQHTSPLNKCPLAGNSVHADKQFLDKYMPRFMDHLHYRIVDVSTIKELCRRWYPDSYKRVPRKRNKHRALDDIKESIEELAYYKRTIFK